MTSASSTESITESSTAVVIALGSNLGPREYFLRRAVHELGASVRVVRQSRVISTCAMDAPKGSPDFLNMVVAGFTHLAAHDLLAAMHAIEGCLGRVRRVINGPRTIDLDLILYGAFLHRDAMLTLPHPRYRQRTFVLEPLQELNLGWTDPETGRSIDALARPERHGLDSRLSKFARPAPPSGSNQW